MSVVSSALQRLGGTRYGMLVWLGLLCLLAAALRLYKLDAQSLWLDEVFTVLTASYPLQLLLAGGELPINFNNPPLYFVLIHLMMDFSPTDFAIRFPSAVAGILLVPATAFLAARLFRRQEALVAAALMALSPMAIHYAQEARSYAIVMLLIPLATAILWQLLHAPTRKGWLLLLLVNALGVYTNYLYLLMVVVQGAFLALWLFDRLSVRGKQGLVGFGLMLVGLLLFIRVANLPVLGSLTQSDGAETPSLAAQLAYARPAAGEAFRWIHLYDNRFITVLFLALSLVALLDSVFKRRIWPSLLLIACILFASVLIFLSNPPGTAIYVRYFVVVLPTYLILVSRGLVVLVEWVAERLCPQLRGVAPERLTPLLLLVVMGGLLLPIHASALGLYYDKVPGYLRLKPPWKEAVAWLEASWQPNQAIVVTSAESQVALGHYMPSILLPDEASLSALIQEGRSAYLVVDSWMPEYTRIPLEQLGFREVARFPTLVIYGINTEGFVPEEKVVVDLGRPARQMFVREGWLPPTAPAGTPPYAHTTGGEATLEVILRPNVAYTMTLTAQALVGSENVQVSINGTLLDEAIPLTDGSWQSVSLTIPARSVQAGLNTISLRPVAKAATTETVMIGNTGVTLPVPITVEARAMGNGDQAMIYLDGVPYSFEIAGRGYGRGYTVLALDSSGRLLASDAFDTCCPEPPSDESHRMSEFIAALPPDTIVIVATRSDASNVLTEEGVAALRSLGGATDIRGQFQWMHAMVGVKGAAPGTAVEVLDPQAATIVLGPDGRSRTLAIRTIEFEPQAR